MIQVILNRKLFNDVYYPLLTDYKKRTEIYYGGAGSGKSVFIAQKILYKAINDKRIVLVVRKTLTSQRRSCWQLLLDTIEKWHLTEYCKINKSDYQINLPNGSIIYIAGIDNPERIKSIVGITDIWTEEATELSIEDFDQLNLRLRSKAPNQQIFVSFNPISKSNWVYNRWFERGTDQDTLITKTTYKDNRFLPEDYIKALEGMITTNPTYYRIYALGEFCSLDKLVYTNWITEEFDHRKIKGELIVGLDFGFSNDTTALTAAIVVQDSKEIYIFREWGSTNKTNDEIANVIKQLGFSKSIIIADSAEPKSIEEIRRLGISKIKASVKGPDSIIHGIQKLQQYKMIVHPSCIETLTELQNYSWEKDKKTNEYTNKPIDLFNHYLDSLRYAYQIVEKGHIRTLSKSILGL